MAVTGVFPALLAAVASAIAVWIIGFNWVLLVRTLTGRATGSPILAAGPLCALLAGGSLVRAIPELGAAWVWLPFAAVLVIDPAALPLVVRAMLARRAQRAPDGGSEGRGDR